MNREPNLDGLLDFADLVDRGESPFFVGRHEELGRLARQADLVLVHWKENRDISGRTLVITGCPGMGKSALLRNFAHTRCNRPDEPGSPLAVMMDVHDLRDAGGIARAFYEAASETRRMGRLLDAIGSDVAKRLKAERTVDALSEMFREDKKLARPICLLVDEIQNVGPKNEEALSKLHNATIGLPILPVYAGLNDSVAVLRRHGISRLGDEAGINLQPLSVADSGQAAQDLFERFRVAGEAAVKEQWIRSIAGASLGFPQHLHVGLKAAARVLAEHAGTATADGLRTALAKAAAARSAYYASRIRDEVHEHGETVVGLVGALKGSNRPLRRRDLTKLALSLPGGDGEGGLCRETAERLVADLIHDGVLQQNMDRTGYVVPIPSMQAWILGDYARSIGYGNGAAAQDQRMGGISY